MEENNDIVESPNNGAYYAQDGSVDRLNIITASGQSINVKKLLIELSYYEDIFNFVVSGYVILRDGVGLIEKLQLTGKEFIEINFGKAQNAATNNRHIFRLYTIPKRTPSGNLNSEFIKLYFCSEELLLSEQIKVTQAYSGESIDSIVEDILLNKLGINPSKIANRIEPTVGKYDFNVVTLKPFEAISWVSCYARPASKPTNSADMVLFETKNGFNFRSLGSLVRQPVYQTYTYQQKNLEQESFGNNLTTVLDYEFTKTFNSLEDINSGTFANRIITLDPLNRTVRVTDFDYKKNISGTDTLNGTSPLSSSRNRFGKAPNESYVGTLKVGISNPGQKTREYIKGSEDAVAEDIFMETFVPNRTAQLSLATYTKAKIRIPGDSNITAGRTINFNLMTLMDDYGQKDRDKYFSGKYLVTAVRHIIQSQGVFQTVLEIAKDSPANAYQASVNVEQELFE